MTLIGFGTVTVVAMLISAAKSKSAKLPVALFATYVAINMVAAHLGYDAAWLAGLL